MSDNERKKEIVKTYMENRVRPIFDQLITALLLALPDNVVTWSANWLNNYNYQINGISNNYNPNPRVPSEQDDTLDLPSHRSLKSNKSNIGGGSRRQGFDQDDTVDYSKQRKQNLQREEDDEAEERRRRAKKQSEQDEEDQESPDRKARRTAVNNHSKVRFIKKTPEQIKRIKELLANSMLFQALDQEDQTIVIGAMEVKQYKPGEWLVQEGSAGVELYLIDKGDMDCFKVINTGDKPKFLKTYKPGESFGELAHLYQAKSNVTCFALDRETFNKIVKDSVSKKRENYEYTISQCNLFRGMDDHERMKLCERIKESEVKAGTVILKQGESSNKFYIISEGRLDASNTKQKLLDYKSGDYFGELALFNKSKIQAKVTAQTNCTLLTIDYDSFKKLMGPVENTMRQNIDKYEKYIQQ